MIIGEYSKEGSSGGGGEGEGGVGKDGGGGEIGMNGKI